MSKRIGPTECSRCTTTSLWLFLKAFASFETRSRERACSLLSISSLGRSFHSQPRLRLKKSGLFLQGLSQATHEPTNPFDDAFLPFDGSGISGIVQDPGGLESVRGPRSIQDPFAKDGERTCRMGPDNGEPQIVLSDPARVYAGLLEGNDVTRTLSASPKLQDFAKSSQNREKRQHIAPVFRKEADRKRSAQIPESNSQIRGGDRNRETWRIQKEALKKKFGSSGWTPRKRLSPDALEGIRALHAQYPEKYSTQELATQFQVSPENIRRILKSKWKPNEEEEVDRRERWVRRGESKWSQLAELGIKPPRKWRRKGIGKDLVSFHRRKGYNFGKGMGTKHSLSGSAASTPEGRASSSMSEMIL